jgi:hypothetical protein
MNALPLSPLTFSGMVRRITADLHPGRSESALCVAVTTLGMVAEGTLSPELAADQLRGLACMSDPDGYNAAVRQVLAVAEVELQTDCAACGVATFEDLCARCAKVAAVTP